MFVVTTYWYVLNSHARDDITSQNTCDIAVDTLVHTKVRGRECDTNSQYTHQDRLQNINDFVKLLQTLDEFLKKIIHNHNMLTHYVCMY